MPRTVTLEHNAKRNAARAHGWQVTTSPQRVARNWAREMSGILCVRLCPQEGPVMALKRRLNGPTKPKTLPRMFQEGPRGPHDGPRKSQRPPSAGLRKPRAPEISEMTRLPRGWVPRYAPKRSPSTLHDGPRNPRDALTNAQDGSRVPETAQDSPRRAPRRLKRVRRGPHDGPTRRPSGLRRPGIPEVSSMP